MALSLTFSVDRFVKQHAYGGYDYDFIENVPEKYICATICSKVLRDPHLTDCCGQHFCESCLEHWFRTQRISSRRVVCPHCREEDFTHILDKPIKREINQLEIHCKNREKGCSWSGSLECFTAHLESTSDGCGYVEVDCTNKCGKKLKRRDLSSHLSNDCSLRKYQCRYCGQEGTYKKITTKHYRKCPDYPLVCPNRCRTMAIKRKNMDLHRSECPLEPVECPFQAAGCEVDLVRKDLDEHIEHNTQVHLLHVMSAYHKVKASNRRLQSEIDEVNQELESVNDELESVYEELKSVKRRCERNEDEIERLRNDSDTL